MDRVASRMQAQIIASCEAILSRPLNSLEREFITCRGGLIALEAIQDHVQTLRATELVRYLASDSSRSDRGAV